jgi:hypothetical protein
MASASVNQKCVAGVRRTPNTLTVYWQFSDLSSDHRTDRLFFLGKLLLNYFLHSPPAHCCEMAPRDLKGQKRQTVFIKQLQTLIRPSAPLLSLSNERLAPRAPALLHWLQSSAKGTNAMRRAQPTGRYSTIPLLKCL